MFRAAAAGPYDEAINKATDENLTSEDWGAIIDICDRVSADPNGPKESVQSLIKRLAHRNANVQLYTLEVANALSLNCGKNLHRELSSRAFTDALLKLANDRNTHNQVKVKILERMKEWSDMFKSDPDLGIMQDAYYRLKQSNPNLEPPAAPQKNQLTEADRLKEEEELQLALKLSLQEEERKKQKQQQPQASSSSAAAGSSSSAAQQQRQQQSTSGQPVPSGTTAATVSRVRALYDFVPSEPGELEFKKGDVICVLEAVYKDWWRGSLRGKTGIFPLNYVEKLADPTPEELAREAQMEAEVFAEIKNVEKLLALLSSGNTLREEDNEEISRLYHQTLAIRPKLIKLIEKYTQKKEDFTQLNEKFIKARRDYEALLEQSMSHSYQQYPARPQGYPPAGPGYSVPTQEPQRYYTPAPTQEPQYPPSSPPPNFQRTPGAAPAPFYVAGAEVPSQPTQPPVQHLPPQPTPQPYPPQQYPQHPQERLPSGSAPSAPIPTSTTSPPPAPHAPYQSPRPQNTSYPPGPQELSTSVYDSPQPTHRPTFPPATYSSPPLDSEDPNKVAASNIPPAPAIPAPQPPVPGSPSQQRHHSGSGPSVAPFGSAYASFHSSAPQQQYGQGQQQGQQSSQAGGAPSAPGAPVDARATLPSRAQPQQYKPYVPPGSAGSGPSAGQSTATPGGPDGMGAGAGTGTESYYRAGTY